VNIFLFILTIVVSILIVRIGAVAFHLTGLEWAVAKFQALSCFSSTGFTTRESELVVSSARRRKIATYLIILGHAGLVAMVATFANSIKPDVWMDRFSLPIFRAFLPTWLLPWFNLFIIIVAIFVVSRIFTNTKVAKKLTAFLKANLVKKEIFAPASFEELMLAPQGYGVSQIDITGESPVAGKNLHQARLRQYDISVLVIQRGDRIIANPTADTTIQPGDKLWCFGKLATMREQIYTLTPAESAPSPDEPEDKDEIDGTAAQETR